MQRILRCGVSAPSAQRFLQPPGSGSNAWRVGVFLLLALLADLLMPPPLYDPRLVIIFVVCGIIALRLSRPLRSEFARFFSAQSMPGPLRKAGATRQFKGKMRPSAWAR